MIVVSDKYQQAVYNTPIYSRLSGRILLKSGREIEIYDNVDRSNVVKGSVSITNQTYSKNRLEFGNAYVGQLDISLYEDIEQNVLYGADIVLFWHLKTTESSYEQIPLGRFIVSKAVRSRNVVKITAYDYMQLLDKEFESTETYGRVYEILQYIEANTGVELAQSEDEIKELTNGNRFITIAEDMDYKTYRDIICDIATMLCSFVVMTRDGKLKFAQYQTTITDVIEEGQRNNVDVAERIINYDSLRFNGKKSVYTVVKSGQEVGSNLLEIDYAPLLSRNHAKDYILQTLQAMIDTISEIYYTPISCDIVSNPALELGDNIAFYSNGVTKYTAPIMYYKWTYHGSMNIKAVGDESISGESKTSKVAAGTADAVTSNETIIFSYENASEVKIQTDDKQIIRIDYVSTKATKGLFHAQILLEVDTDAVITFKYTINSNIDLYFMPAQSMAAGKHIITLFYPLNAIPQNTANSLRVSAQLSEGVAIIAPTGIKAAVAAQGLAEGAPEWDGTLEIEEKYTNIAAAISIEPFNGQATTQFITPTAGRVSEVFTPITASISIAGLNEHIGSGEVTPIDFRIARAIVAFNTYENAYVKAENGRIKLQDVYVYESTAEAIDDGSACGVTVVTNDKASVESVGIENGEL